MLVLTRKLRETVIIGDNEVIIEIVRIDGDRVRIGVTAPESVTIHRGEVFEAIKREGRK